MAAEPVAIGIDVGGTKLLAGALAADGTVLDRLRADTPAHDGDAVLDAVEALARRLGAPRLPVGVGVAGIVDLDGRLRYAPNIAWADAPVREQLAGRLGCPVVVENDANAAAWGEWRAGAGRAAAGSLAMLTVGTGIGGGYVLDGRLVRGAHGMAAEFGHVLVQEGGPECACGNRGCLEALASGTAIGRLAGELLARGDEPSLLPAGVAPTGKQVTVAARSGDALSRRVLAACGFWLGVGIASVVNALDPAVVVVGGGAMQAGEYLLAPARQAYRARVIGRAHRDPPEVVEAALADDAGLVGAALLALHGVPGVSDRESSRPETMR